MASFQAKIGWIEREPDLEKREREREREGETNDRDSRIGGCGSLVACASVVVVHG